MRQTHGNLAGLLGLARGTLGLVNVAAHRGQRPDTSPQRRDSHTDVSRAATADLFHHPTFRPATPVEIEFAHQVINDAGYEIYPWDAESSAGTAPMMIIATSVRVVEGLVRHGNCARQRRTLGAADPDGRPR